MFWQGFHKWLGSGLCLWYYSTPQCAMYLFKHCLKGIAEKCHLIKTTGKHWNRLHLHTIILQVFEYWYYDYYFAIWMTPVLKLSYRFSVISYYYCYMSNSAPPNPIPTHPKHQFEANNSKYIFHLVVKHSYSWGFCFVFTSSTCSKGVYMFFFFKLWDHVWKMYWKTVVP